jgi:hypothetical protein
VCREKLREARVFFRFVANRSAGQGEAGIHVKKKNCIPAIHPAPQKKLKSNLQLVKIT